MSFIVRSFSGRGAVEAEAKAKQNLHAVTGGGTLFLLQEGLIWTPPDTWDLQCVALTKKGERCRDTVFDQGQVWIWAGPFAVFISPDWVGRLLSQTCRVHDNAMADGYEPVECVLLPTSSGLRGCRIYTSATTTDLPLRSAGCPRA